MDEEMSNYRQRSDGWTPLRRKTFLRALSETGCVRDACARARISNTSAYRMRRRCETFERAWDRALASVAPTIEQAAFERAVLGWEEPVWHGGKIVGHRRRYSDNLLRLLLTRQSGRGEQEARGGGWDRATQAETDALLLKNLLGLKRRREAEAARARAALPVPPTQGTEAGPTTGNTHAGDDDRRAAGAVRDGHGPRISLLS